MQRIQQVSNTGALAIVLMLSACSASVPKCGDSETVNLVKEIADSEVTKRIGASTAETLAFQYKLEAISTTGTHDTTGAHQCSAQMIITSHDGRTISDFITYTVALSDDGEEFNVSVYGL